MKEQLNILTENDENSNENAFKSYFLSTCLKNKKLVLD